MAAFQDEHPPMTEPLSIDAFVEALTLEPVGPGSFRGSNLAVGHGVVFGGQLMAQALVAGLADHPGKTVKSIHTVFARGASPDEPVELEVEALHLGRSFGSSTVTIRQGDRLCTRSLVLATADGPDLIRHGAVPTAGPGPDGGAGASHLPGAWEVRVADGVDVSDPDAVGPAALDVWTRFVGAPDDPAVNQALLVFATDGFLIGTAMRPHAGVGQAQAHVTVATGVVSHTMTFHEPCRAGQWLLLAHESPYAGRGRSYGRADVFQDDRLVASFVQDNMIQAMPDRAGGPRA